MMDRYGSLDQRSTSSLGDYTTQKCMIHRPNSPGPPMDDWKVTDDSSVNFHDVFFFIFCQIIAKNEEKYIMEIYG